MKIALLGLPGAGKGTQAEKLAEAYDLPAVGMGDLLRAESDAVIEYSDVDKDDRQLYFTVDDAVQRIDTFDQPPAYDHVMRTDDPDTLPAHQETIGERLNKGEGPSTETSAYFLEKELMQHEGYVLDGFPRWGEQARAMDQIDELDVIIYLDVDERRIFYRLGKRGRSDDTFDAIEERIDWQRAGWEEVADHYSDGHVPVERVDANQHIDDVFAEIEDVVAQYADQ